MSFNHTWAFVYASRAQDKPFSKDVPGAMGEKQDALKMGPALTGRIF